MGGGVFFLCVRVICILECEGVPCLCSNQKQEEPYSALVVGSALHPLRHFVTAKEHSLTCLIPFPRVITCVQPGGVRPPSFRL